MQKSRNVFFSSPDVERKHFSRGFQEVTASQGSQKQEKGEKVPDPLGGQFFGWQGGSFFSEDSGTSNFSTRDPEN